MGFIIGGFHNVMFHNFAIFFSPLNLDLDFQNSLPFQSHPKIATPEFQCFWTFFQQKTQPASAENIIFEEHFHKYHQTDTYLNKGTIEKSCKELRHKIWFHRCDIFWHKALVGFLIQGKSDWSKSPWSHKTDIISFFPRKPQVEPTRRPGHSHR